MQSTNNFWHLWIFMNKPGHAIYPIPVRFNLELESGKYTLNVLYFRPVHSSSRYFFHLICKPRSGTNEIHRDQWNIRLCNAMQCNSKWPRKIHFLQKRESSYKSFCGKTWNTFKWTKNLEKCLSSSDYRSTGLGSNRDKRIPTPFNQIEQSKKKVKIKNNSKNQTWKQGAIISR